MQLCSTFLSNNINSDQHSCDKINLILTIVDSDEDVFKMQSVEKKVLADLPEGYVCKVLRVENYININSYSCSFKIELDSEGNIKKWVSAYNERSKFMKDVEVVQEKR